MLKLDADCRKGGTTFSPPVSSQLHDVRPLTLASTCGVITKFTATEALDYLACLGR